MCIENEHNEYSRLAHLVSALRPNQDPREVLVVGLTAYFDGSWNNDNPPVMTVGGLISSAQRWQWFEREWKKLLIDFKVGYFRMEEFAHFDGHFIGWENREDDRRKFLGRAIGLIHRTAWQSFAASLVVEDYKQCNQQYMLHEEGYRPYPLCGCACIDHVRVWCLNQPRRYPLSEILYVFEKDDPDQNCLRQLADQLWGIVIQTERKIPKGIFKQPIGALQAADLIAWHVHAIARKNEEDVLDRYREDFKILFTKLPSYPHHVSLSMKREAQGPHPQQFDRLVSIRNEHSDDLPSLIRICQDYKIARRVNSP